MKSKYERLYVENCSMGADDAALKKRKEIAERLKRGESVIVEGNSGRMTEDNKNIPDDQKLKISDGKLASPFYWYERDPELFAAEKKAMEVFPNFKLGKLSDGRLYWEGSLNPNGADGAVWHIMAIYDNNHPHNNSYGGSVKVYSVIPDLEELNTELGRLPHILKDSEGSIYMCTARPEDIQVGAVSSSAATHIGNAAKWIKVVEDWMEGIIGDEVFDHIY